MSKPENILHLECDCHCHELHAERWVEFPDVAQDQWFFSFWVRGYTSCSTLKYKLKCIWHIIRTGQPYGDEVCLSRDQMLKLKYWVDSQLINEIKND